MKTTLNENINMHIEDKKEVYQHTTTTESGTTLRSIITKHQLLITLSTALLPIL